MVLVRAQRLDLELVALLDLQADARQFGADARQFGDDLWGEESAAVLDGEDEVVVHVVDVVPAALEARAGEDCHALHYTRWPRIVARPVSLA